MEANLNQYICFNLYKGWREVSTFYRDVLGKDVSPQKVYVLELCEMDQKITMNDLSSAMHLDGSAVSTLISRMEKKSLVRREHGVEDRRVVYVILTEEGHKVREKLRSQLDILIKKMTEDISESDIKVMQSVVNSITKNRADYRESI